MSDAVQHSSVDRKFADASQLFTIPIESRLSIKSRNHWIGSHTVDHEIRRLSICISWTMNSIRISKWCKNEIPKCVKYIFRYISIRYWINTVLSKICATLTVNHEIQAFRTWFEDKRFSCWHINCLHGESIVIWLKESGLKDSSG